MPHSRHQQLLPAQPSDIARDVRRMLQPLRTDMLRLLRALVRTNTIAIPPNGSETAGQIVLRDFLREYGLRPQLYETDFVAKSGHKLAHPDRAYKGRKNLVVHRPGSGRGKSLLLNGHMDTVPAGRLEWSTPPLSPVSRNGRIYGLGTFDMKGGLAAQAAVLCAIRKANIRLSGDLIFESVVDEEWGGGAGTLAGRLRGDNANACVISESTQLEIFRATRGGFVMDLLVRAGDPSAYFSKGEVLSPAVPLGRLLAWIDSLAKQRAKTKPRGPYAEFPDPAPVQVLAIEANRFDPDVPLSVPLNARVRMYCQLLPHERPDLIVTKIRDSLTRFAKRDPFFRAHGIETHIAYGPLLGHELALDHPWTQCMSTSAAAALGKPARITAAPYPCDAFIVQREFGIPTLLFGPSGGGAHNPDEYVDTESVFQTAEVLLAAALSWCGA